MGLFTLHKRCVSWLLNILKIKLDSQSRLTIPEFSGYHCIHCLKKIFLAYICNIIGRTPDDAKVFGQIY